MAGLLAEMFPSGWAIDQEERNWKYRLSVYYTRGSDSGNMTCRSPDGTDNTIYLDVRGMDRSSRATRIHTGVGGRRYVFSNRLLTD